MGNRGVSAVKSSSVSREDKVRILDAYDLDPDDFPEVGVGVVFEGSDRWEKGDLIVISSTSEKVAKKYSNLKSCEKMEIKDEDGNIIDEPNQMIFSPPRSVSKSSVLAFTPALVAMKNKGKVQQRPQKKEKIPDAQFEAMRMRAREILAESSRRISVSSNTAGWTKFPKWQYRPGGDSNHTSWKGSTEDAFSYNDLKKVFGPPDSEYLNDPEDWNPDSERVSVRWNIEFDDGVTATIYDWKEPNPASSSYPDEKSLWTIGGKGDVPDEEIPKRINAILHRFEAQGKIKGERVTRWR